MTPNQAHLPTEEPPLTWLYLVECLATLALRGLALWLCILFGWATLG